MNKMKKALALMLALMMVMTLIPFGALAVSAAGDYYIELVADAEEVNAGDDLVVELSLYGHEELGLTGCQLELGFDPNVFELVTTYDEDEEMWIPPIEVGSKFNASSNKYIMFPPIDEETGYMQRCLVQFQRATATASQAVKTNLFFTATFKVKDDAPSGEYTIDIINYNKKNIICYGNVVNDYTWEPITVTVNGVDPVCEHVYDNACDADCNLCGEAREVAGHNYADATCTVAKTCKICGATEGEALGHTWVDGEDAKTCSVCGATQVIGQVVNGDFENGTDGWTVNGFASISNDAHGGTGALKMDNPTSWSEVALQSVNVKADTDYVISWYAKRVSGNGAFNLILMNGSDVNYSLNGQNWMNETSGDWVKYEVTLNTGANTAIKIKLTSEATNAGIILVDDVVVREMKEATSDGYITNGNFETGDITGWENVWGSCTTSIVDGRNGGSALNILAGQWNIVRQKVTVEANTDYVITLWAKDVKDMTLLIKDGADTGNVKQTTINGGADWTKTTLEFNSGDLTEIYVCLMGNVADSKITCDDVVMAVKGDEPEEPDTPDTPVDPAAGLINGDFETGNASGWEIHQSTKIDAEAAQTGSYGAHLMGDGGWGGMLDQTIATIPGKSYEITVNVKVIKTGINFQIKSAAGVQLDGAWFDTNISEWTTKSYIVTAADESILINFCGSGKAAEEAYIDNISVVEVKEATTDGYLTNGDFETGKTDSWTNLWGSSTIEMVEGYNSSYAIKGTASSAYNITYQEVAVTPNTDYTIIVYSKNSVDSALWIKNDGGNGDIANKTFNAGSDWAKMTLTFNSGSNSKIWVGLMGINPGATYTVDSLTMFEAKVASNDGYIVNGTFETSDVAPWENLYGNCPTVEVIAGGKDSDWALNVVSGQWQHVRQTNIAVEANTIYKITLWAKNTNNMNLLVKDGGDKANLANQAIVGGDDWTENVVEFNTGANTTILVSLMGGEGEDQYGIFDEIVMEKVGSACTHSYDNACDKDCNDCGAEREVGDHDYADATCTAPKTCKNCGATEGKVAEHDYAAATCTAAKTCKVCGATEGEKLAHTYKTVTKKATTTANGYTVKRCSVCSAETGKKTLYKVSSITLSKTSYTYNGKVQKPTVTVKNSAGTKLTEGSSYTVKYSAESKAAGTYKVTITLKGNYSGTKTLSYTIKAQDVSKCTVTLSKTSYTYDGKVKKPTVTVKNAAGTKLTEGGSYTVTYASGRKSAGTYKVTIKMKGNYTGTVTKTFKINPVNVSKCKITLSATSYTYNGKVQKPTVTVKNASGTKLSTASYTVSYASGRKNVGTYKVTIKMKGNYTGTKTLTFKINPAKTSISSVTSASKKLTVKWAKKTTQVTGYEIQYSTSKSFSSYKSKTISKNSTISAALTGLKAKTTYYIRVRTYKTVNGVKYYSGWTTIKSAKTK